MEMEKSKVRLEILEKINKLEEEGKFDQDVENDPPYTPIKPGMVDYTRKKLSSKIKSRLADFISFRYFHHLMHKGVIVVDGVEGIENLTSLNSGAVVTANHFNPFDSIPIHDTCKKYLRKRQLYKVIKEGNYTFPGIYGYFMKNCYTIPLASDRHVMKEMLAGVDTILQEGKLLLVYAEQSMWWNYRKPKPLKNGAFSFAAKNNVPVLPMFTTLRDTDKLDADGFPLQAYTLHIGKPIYPKKEYNQVQNIKYMKEENERVWKEIYETTYGIPLTYITK